MAIVLLHLLILAMSSWSSSAVGNFSEEPQNTTCVLGEVFAIRCRPPGYSTTVRWLFGGERLSINYPPPGVVPTSGSHLFQLNVTCVPERHYLTVQCIAVIDIGVEEEDSPPAWIRVQGFPDRVEGVNTWSNCSSVLLVWDFPLGPQLTYCVTVYNTTVSGPANNTDAGRETVVCMLRHPSFVLTDDEASPLHTFEFVVTAVSELGPGPPSPVVTANFTFADKVTCEAATPIVGGASSFNINIILIIIGISLYLLVILSAIFVAVSVMCCIVIRRHKNQRGVMGMEMTVCDAYDNPNKTLDSGVDLQTKAEFMSYETIPETEHVYEHIRS